MGIERETLRLLSELLPGLADRLPHGLPDVASLDDRLGYALACLDKGLSWS
ncbi:hypothetical protein GCM10012278_38820 [Nonomuraea glycinis]|uniref:Uncharacterized protein n=1 Tax=Nonomuraea glycinis TaxID=2047744 RepID=A0A918A8D4_9ACTN|nr:hypothetical protein GCM10012278_38820 [Nonomuraea glycinis]